MPIPSSSSSPSPSLTACCNLCGGSLEGSVLFLCACTNNYCSTCCLQRLATNRKTYHAGTPCPSCKKESENVEGKIEAFEEENRLVIAAFQRLLERESVTSPHLLTEEDYIPVFKELRARLRRRDYNHGNIEMRDLLEYATDITLIEFNDEELDQFGRLRMKLCLARVEYVLQSGKKVKQGMFADGPLRHINFRMSLRPRLVVESSVVNKDRENFSVTSTPVTTRKVKSNDNQSLSGHLITTPASCTETVVTSGSTEKEKQLGLLIDMLQSTQEQLRQAVKRSDEQFQLVLTKSEEQNSRLLSMERKINSLISGQPIINTSASTIVSNCRPDVAAYEEKENYEGSSNGDTDSNAENEDDWSPRKKCAFADCKETFSIAAPHNKREFCDAHSPWRQFCKNRKNIIPQNIRYQPKHQPMENDSSDNSEEKKGDNEDNNDDFCRACLLGGELILCDYCTLSYHVGCAGLKCAPRGAFKCPMCCGTMETRNYDELSMKQCEFEGCLEVFPTSFRQHRKKWCQYHLIEVRNARQKAYRLQKKGVEEKESQGIEQEYTHTAAIDDDKDDDDDVDDKYYVSGKFKLCTVNKCTTKISTRCKFCSHHAKIKKQQRNREWLKRKAAEIAL